MSCYVGRFSTAGIDRLLAERMDDLDPTAFDREQLHRALLGLMDTRDSVGAVVNETGISRSTVYALRNGERDFTLVTLTAAVKAYRPDGELPMWIEAWERLYGARTTLAASSAGMLPPLQLPPGTTPFVGREREMTELNRLTETYPGTAVTVCVTGTGGLGKTGLVIQWARAAAERFPDGPLFVDLRGYDVQRPVEPADALLTMLRALGDTGDVAVTEEERVARYRKLISSRRMLLIFDNVRDVDQVRPLLPPTDTCVTVLTSRDNLTTLHALIGVRRMVLQPLPKAEAERLFDALAAPATVADSQIIADLVDRCSGFPLALRIAGALASGRSLGATENMLRDLQSNGRPLDVFRAGDGRTDLRDVFSRTYRTLDAGSAQAFRLLSIHPGQIFDTYAVAALIGAGVLTARRRLEVLRRFGLVHDHSDTHFTTHDLLRDYSRELGAAPESSGERRPALIRLLDHYLAGAQSAETVLHAGRAVVGSDAPTSSPLPPFADVRAAREWLDRERLNLVAAVVEAARIGDAGLACALADAVWRYLHEGGHYLEAVTVHSRAAEIARTSQSWPGRANALDHLGIAYQLQGNYEGGLACLTEARQLFRLSGDRLRDGETLGHLGTLHARWGRYSEAVEHMQAGLAIAEEACDEVAVGNALNNLGLNYQKWGRYVEALTFLNRAVDDAERRQNQATKAIALNNRCLVQHRLGHRDDARRDIEEALEIARSKGLAGVEAEALDSLGSLLLTTGHLPEAQDRLDEALAMHRAAGDRAAEALSLHHLGQLRFAEGRHDEALRYQEQAAGIAEEIGERGLQTNICNARGAVLRGLGRHDEATEQYAEGLALAGQTENRDDEAAALVGAGHLAAFSGDRAAARERWASALLIYDELGLPDAEAVRGLLAGDQSTTGDGSMLAERRKRRK
jgi:tetratricopeptide (TPR) repeat protein